jgi:hypothetical protein
MITKEFITAGRAIFTLAIPESFLASHPECKPHYTYRVVRKPGNDKWPEAWFINLLAGPNNTQDYQPLGKLNPTTGAIALTRVTRFTDEALPVRLVRRAVAAIWQGQADAITAAGFELHHEGRCGRCGRVLTVPESIVTGFGPECASRL